MARSPRLPLRFASTGRHRLLRSLTPISPPRLTDEDAEAVYHHETLTPSFPRPRSRGERMRPMHLKFTAFLGIAYIITFGDGNYYQEHESTDWMHGTVGDRPKWAPTSEEPWRH